MFEIVDIIDLLFNIGLYHYLILALVLFLIGLWGTIVSRNLIKVLISIEFMVTAVNINFIAIASFFDNFELNGFVVAIFYTAIGAVEIAIALAILYQMFKYKESIDSEEYEGGKE